MDTLSKRIDALESLGDYFSNFDEKKPEYFYFVEAIEKATTENGWFTKEECFYAITYWGTVLEKVKIQEWISPYALLENQSPKTIALVLAGNIPMVGFHDIIAVWITGNTPLIKCASKDKVLIPFVINNNPLLKSISLFTDEKLQDFDAVIATGSNNSARYFDYYFAKYPSLIRKNRNGVAVLNGKETKSELENLGRDMLQYFGLGCRNVAKLYLPNGFDLNRIFSGIYPLSSIIDVKKYSNNYHYNRSVFLMSEFNFADNGFFILKEDTAISSPIGCAFYQYYDDANKLKDQLEDQKDNIQCIVTNEPYPNAVSFGQTQIPSLSDYADGVDTIKFLKSL